MKCSACSENKCEKNYDLRDRCCGNQENVDCSCKCQQDGTGKFLSVLGGTAAVAGGLALTFATGGIAGIIGGSALVGGGSSMITTPIVKEIQGERITASGVCRDVALGTALGAFMTPANSGAFFLNSAKGMTVSLASHLTTIFTSAGMSKKLDEVERDIESNNTKHYKTSDKNGEKYDEDKTKNEKGKKDNDQEQSDESESDSSINKGMYLPQRELSNTKTRFTIGGSRGAIQNQVKGIHNRRDFEIAHFFSRWTLDYLQGNLTQAILKLIEEEFCILMIKEDHRKCLDTGSSRPAQWARYISGVNIEEVGIATAIWLQFDIFDELGLLPQYTTGIVQMLNRMFELDIITAEEFNKILEKLLELLNSNERNGNYKMPVRWISTKIGKLFKKLRSLILRSKK